MAVAILFGTFFLLLLIGVPVAFALVTASLSTVLYLGLPSVAVVLQTAAGASTASLIAIPLFIFAGELMMRGGISDRLIAFAASLVGKAKGGLAQINVLSSLFFGGVSGSAIADVSAIGGTMIPQMVNRGYHRDFAVAASVSAALVALLVPPSHNLILYSASAGGSISIADLFAAGIVPALLLTSALMITSRIIAGRRGYAAEGFPGFAAVLTRMVAALPGLLLVALIFVGIRAGIFTAIESAAIAVGYATLVTGIVYRRLDRAVFREAVTGAARTAGGAGPELSLPSGACRREHGVVVGRRSPDLRAQRPCAAARRGARPLRLQRVGGADLLRQPEDHASVRDPDRA